MALAVLLLLGAANAGATPGTVQAPPGPGFVDASTGEAWTHVTATMRGSFVLTGPARFQVGVRINLTPDGTGAPAIISVWHAGKPLAQFRLQPKPGTDTWKDDASLKPSTTVGFLVDVPDGPQPYEFRLNGGGAAGAAVRVIDAAQSKRPLSANAPVLKSSAPVVAATPTTPGADATPTPAVAAAATPTPAPAPATETATPPTPGGAAPALTAWLGGGNSWRSEQSVLGPRHQAQDAFAGLRWNASSSLFASAGVEWRSGKQRVLLFEHSPKETREDRFSFDLAGGTRLVIAGLDVSVGPAVRLSRQQDAIAPHEYVVAGGFAGMTVPAGFLDVHASGEAGAAIYDGTPPEFRMGKVVARTAWNLGASTPVRGLRIGAEYRGENVVRTYSERVSHGAFATASFGF